MLQLPNPFVISTAKPRETSLEKEFALFSTTLQCSNSSNGTEICQGVEFVGKGFKLKQRKEVTRRGFNFDTLQ